MYANFLLLKVLSKFTPSCRYRGLNLNTCNDKTDIITLSAGVLVAHDS